MLVAAVAGVFASVPGGPCPTDDQAASARADLDHCVSVFGCEASDTAPVI